MSKIRSTQEIFLIATLDFKMFEFSYFFSILISLAAVFSVIKINTKIGILDFPNERSSHVKAVPRSGGIGFITAFLLSFVLFESMIVLEHLWLFASIFLVFITGVYDDYVGLKPKGKFLAIAFAVCMLYMENIYIDSLGIYFGVELKLFYFALPFTMFAVVGFTNALNLIDGLDGLASSVSIAIFVSFLYIGLVFNDKTIFLISFFALSVLSAYLIFNWAPARVFMGDSGSLTLGFIICVVAILSLKYIHPVTILYLCAIPIIDTLVVMIRRISIGVSPFRADKTHIHHILHRFFLSTQKSVIFLFLVQLLFCFLGYVVARHIELYPEGLFPFAMIVAFAILLVISYMLSTAILQNENQI